METRSLRKRKRGQETNAPSKHRKTDEEDIPDEEKFPFFLDLPVDLQIEIYQRCTLPVKIHFNEEFGNTGGWLHQLSFPKFPIIGLDLKPNILTRFTSLKRLYYNDVSFTDNLAAYSRYLTSIEELRITANTPEKILPLIDHLTNLRQLVIPHCLWKDKEFYRLKKLTGLRSLYVNCRPSLLEHMTSFRYLTQLDCIVKNSDRDQHRIDLPTNLKSLQINGHTIDEKVFGLTQLERLKLFAAKFEEIDLLANCKYLTRLELGVMHKSSLLKLTCELPQVRNLSLRYVTSEADAVLSKFANVTSLKIRGVFKLPPNPEQLKRLSASSIKYSTDDIVSLSKLTNLRSLSLHGTFVTILSDEIHRLPTTIRELSLEESNASNENILPHLTTLRNLERVTLFDVAPLVGCDPEVEVKNLLKSMPQLTRVCFQGIFGILMSFQKHKAWFDFLKQNKIYADVVFE